jgi:cation:H+ antiporter
MSVWEATLLFAVSGLVLTAGGAMLARAGDDLAERTGPGRLFVGMLIVALATSLPELVTDVSAAVGEAPDLAVGDLFGSSMANMAILAVLVAYVGALFAVWTVRP